MGGKVGGWVGYLLFPSQDTAHGAESYASSQVWRSKSVRFLHVTVDS